MNTKKFFNRSLLTTMTVGLMANFSIGVVGSSAALSKKPEFTLATQFPVNGVAEIITATPNGKTLVYTNAAGGEIGIINIINPANPKLVKIINVQKDGVGEPTSVAITDEGKYAVVAIRLGDDVDHANPGMVRVYSIADLKNISLVKEVSVGIGPDAVALAGSGKTLRAVVAIEDEETNDEGDATIPGVRPGRIDVVGLEDLYGAPGTGVQSLDLVAALTAAGVGYPEDPQPEFVSINKETMQAAVTLQENNAIAIVDLSNPAVPALTRVFSAGTVDRVENADLTKNKEISLSESFTGRREPDGIAWINGNIFATANEGDTSVGDDGIFPGSRGFTLMDNFGSVVYDSGAQSEQHAVLYGHYPDSRSAKKGVEIESVATGVYGCSPYLFVGSERGSHVEVYRVNNPESPEFVQLLPTGMSPEGLLTITNRADHKQLFVTANETDGSITIFQYSDCRPLHNFNEPQIVALDESIPWGAVSGLTTDGHKLYAVPDNAFNQSRIFTISPEFGKGRMTIEAATMLTNSDGSPLAVDPEGVAQVADGFWIASEGSKVAKNELIKVSPDGVVLERVTLSPEMQARFSNPNISTGFEGVAASSDGKTLYVAVQRGFDPAIPFGAILRYDTESGTWTSALYPLDQHSKDPATYWTGLSEVQLTEDGRLLLLERDKGGGENGAINAEIKRVYSVKAADITDVAVLSKTLVQDLRKKNNYLQEKAEGMVIFNHKLWVANDNDGAGWTRMLKTTFDQ
jgi:hypothetical protein